MTTKTLNDRLANRPYDRPNIHVYRDSFSVDGDVYNKYTRKPARIITIVEAAQMAGVTARTMKTWLKRPLAPRQLSYGKDGIRMLDYEVQTWLNTVINAPRVKRSWTRAVDYLKKLCLINRDTLLEELQKRKDQPWTDIQRRVNHFDQSHVEAYQRGVADAISIVKKHGVESWDYHPEIGQMIHVGGCVGILSSIDTSQDQITVEGVYVGYVGEDKDGKELPPYRESWRYYYKLSDVLEADVRPWWPTSNDQKHIRWDYEHILHRYTA